MNNEFSYIIYINPSRFLWVQFHSEKLVSLKILTHILYFLISKKKIHRNFI